MGYYVTVEANVKIYVEDLNPEGRKTILFLHGWPGSTKLFEYQFDQLPKRGYRCIGIDTRGFGFSDKPFHGYDYGTLADDVREVIDALGLKDIILAGHSNGGAIATKYMGRHCGYGVSKLALFAAGAPSAIKRPDFPYGADQKDIEQTIRDTYTDRPNMLIGFGNRFFFQHTTEAFSEWFLQVGLQAAGWATAAVAETWIREVLFAEAESIQVPTLLIHGIHDEIVSYELGEIMHRLIKNSELIPFYYSGHGAFYDQQEEFNETLASFIER